MKPKNKKYKVTLSIEERDDLSTLVSNGTAAAKKIIHAQILLKADQSLQGLGWTDKKINEAFEVSSRTIERVRQQYVEEGIEAALNRKKRQIPGNQKFDGQKEAYLIAIACSVPPEGRQRWTLHLLANKMVELRHFDNISHETIRQTLKKNEIKPWLKEQWCIPPKANADFVCAMEDILEVYHRLNEKKNPLVCLDEATKQHVKETRLPLSAEPGQAERYDYEYFAPGPVTFL